MFRKDLVKNKYLNFEIDNADLSFGIKILERNPFGSGWCFGFSFINLHIHIGNLQFPDNHHVYDYE